MISGEKSVSEKIVYQMLDELKKKEEDPVRVLRQAIDNASPNYEVKPRRLGGASYLVPIEVRRDRKLFLALNWIIEAAKARSNKEFHSFSKKLLAEIVEASKNQGQESQKNNQLKN